MAATHEPCGEGYIFFQGPTPKTGTQPDLPSFLEDLQQAQTRFAALNTVPKVGIGTAAALSFVLFIVLIIPTGPTPLYCTSILLLLLLLLLLPRLWRLSKRACVSVDSGIITGPDHN